MATLELPRPLLSHDQDKGEEDEPMQQSSITDGRAFPDVPTHVPGSGQDWVRTRAASKGLGGERSRVSGGSSGGDKGRASVEVEGEEEMEEVLEELQEDEIEEMADEEWSYDSMSNLLGQEVETMTLLQTAQSVCIATIQTLLRSVSSSTSQTALLGGRDAVDDLIRASDTAAANVASTGGKPSTGAAGSPLVDASTQATSTQTIQRLSTLLDHLPAPSMAGEEGGGAEDTSVLTALRDIIGAINAAKLTVDENMQGDGSLLELPSPTASQTSSISPIEGSQSTYVGQQQPSRAAWVTGTSGRTSSAPVTTSAAGSNASMSREELRNPFMDSDPRPQSALSEERHRERVDREADGWVKLVKMMESLDKRSGELLASLETSSPAMEAYEEKTKAWTRLQDCSRNTGELLALRRSQTFVPSSNKEVKRREGSPTCYSPTYSPLRGRSRRNSVTSLNSFTSSANAPLSSSEAGDPTGEATTAGIGVGPAGSLSRLSSPGVRNPSTTPGTAATAQASPLTGSILSRRGSTKSEGTASYSVHSPPPRYSEESIRLWSTGHRDAEMGGALEGARSARASSDRHSTFSTKTLPAYNTNDGAYQPSVDKKGSSTSSLLRAETSSLSVKMDEGRERSRSASDTAKMVASSTPLTPTNGARFSPSAVSEHQARTSQDLSMIQTSIDRLYAAVPQLNDQRASSPVEVKQRQAQRRDEMLNLIERLSKGGRMEDQRAKPPVDQSVRPGAPAALDPVGESSSVSASSSATPTNGRLARRLGSISFSSLSLRRAASVLGNEGKGKERERSGNGEEGQDEGSSTSARGDLDELAMQFQASTRDRRYEDQRAQIQAKPKRAKKPSKLDLMGVSTFNDDVGAGEDDDDGLFAALSASLSSSRMSDQDAEKRPLPLSHGSQLRSPPARKGTSAATSAPSTANVNAAEGVREGVQQGPSSPRSPLRVGESTIARKDGQGRGTDVSSRGLIDATTDDGKRACRQALVYIAESQPRLGWVSVSIWAKSNVEAECCGDEPLCYHFDASNPTRLNVTYRQSSYSFLLPCEAAREEGAGKVAPWKQDHWHLRLPMEASDRQSRVGEAVVPLCASTLQAMRPTQLLCDGCQVTIAETGSIEQYHSLPSQHWEELIDAWMCHADQQLNKGMIDTQKKLDEHRGLQRGQVRVADDFLVLDSTLLSSSNTQQRDTRLYCTQCQSTLGQTASSGAVKLFKYAIRASSSSQPSPPSLLGPVIANELIRLSQAHATRHFILQDDTGADFLQLWLFLESFHLAASDHADAFPACKVMYREPEAGPKASPKPPPSLAWAQPDIVEPIQYPAPVCRLLKQLLSLSTLSYPPSQQLFAGLWTVAFLPTSPPCPQGGIQRRARVVSPRLAT